MTSYIGEIVQDEKGDLILTFPPELLNELDWADRKSTRLNSSH